jgi:hypothetical protein
MKSELQNYDERLIRWQGVYINQLSITNNFLQVTSIGLLAYFIKNACSLKIEISCLFIAIFFAFISTVAGALVLVSRLYDFRITSIIIRLRKEYDSPLKVSKFNRPTCRKQIIAVVTILFCDLNPPPIPSKNESKIEFIKKFHELRELSHTLGTITLRLTKIQIGLIILSVFLYFFSKL